MLYPNATDDTLVLLTLAGETDAYEALVRRYQRAVLAAAASVTHNTFLAEDAAQDAFVTAWMKLDTLGDAKKFAPWVCRIAKNCAVSLLRRYRTYLSLDSIALSESSDDISPEAYVLEKEEYASLHTSVERLPQRIRTIIHLHYFEGLSIVEIAERLSIASGTVKSQLHDGRKHLRKDLGAMNERENDTLVEKVLKKVAELKLWQLRASKDGFADVYADVLRDVENLPESDKKYHALADVLLRGWWWIPERTNDELFARLKDAAERGHNDEAMSFIVSRELDQIPYYDKQSKIEFIREKQLPYLEKAGFTRALGVQYFWLGYLLSREEKPEEASDAFAQAKKHLQPTDSYYTLASLAPDAEARLKAELGNKPSGRYGLYYHAYNLRNVDGLPCLYENIYFGKGFLNSVYTMAHQLWLKAALCDGKYFDPALRVGESLTGSDGTVLRFASDGECVHTPAGDFDGCQVWETLHTDPYTGRSTFRVTYKDGVGIVRFSVTNCGVTDTRTLTSCSVIGGTGLLPLHVGNTWEYVSERDAKFMRTEFRCQVMHADKDGAVIGVDDLTERVSYDEDSWLEMIEQVRNDYSDHKNKLLDVTHAIDRAEALAVTPYQKAHTKAAASVARRILATDGVFNPAHTEKGYWNFFQKDTVRKKDGKITLNRDHRWSFEWKGWCDGIEPLLCNHIYGILQDATKYLWSDEWKLGMDTLIEYSLYEEPIKTAIRCTDGGTVTTGAGTFENCLRLELDITGMSNGRDYRGGKKEYYFAEGIGIVRFVNEFKEETLKAVYDLVAYEGTGEGYMPVIPGLVRRYEAIGLTDGFYGAAEFTYAEDEGGDTVIFADKTGVQQILAPITRYSSIHSEKIEEQLWDENKRAESRVQCDVNDVQLLLHFLSRGGKTRAVPERAVDRMRFKLRMIESFGENGEIPRAWLGYYYCSHFYMACYLFGCHRMEEGYEHLTLALDHYGDWNDIPDGEALPLGMGDTHLFGDIKLLKGKDVLLLPDGTKVCVQNDGMFSFKASLMYYGMTAKKGWEWFNPARGEERFQAFVSRVRALMDAEKKK